MRETTTRDVFQGGCEERRVLCVHILHSSQVLACHAAQPAANSFVAEEIPHASARPQLCRSCCCRCKNDSLSLKHTSVAGHLINTSDQHMFTHNWTTSRKTSPFQFMRLSNTRSDAAQLRAYLSPPACSSTVLMAPSCA